MQYAVVCGALYARVSLLRVEIENKTCQEKYLGSNVNETTRDHGKLRLSGYILFFVKIAMAISLNRFMPSSLSYGPGRK